MSVLLSSTLSLGLNVASLMWSTNYNKPWYQKHVNTVWWCTTDSCRSEHAPAIDEITRAPGGFPRLRTIWLTPRLAERGIKKRECKRAGLIKAMSRRPGFEYAKRSPSVESVYRRPGLIRQRVGCFSCCSSRVQSSDSAAVPLLSSTPLSIILKLVSRALELPSSVVVISLFVHHCLCFPHTGTHSQHFVKWAQTLKCKLWVWPWIILQSLMPDAPFGQMNS